MRQIFAIVIAAVFYVVGVHAGEIRTLPKTVIFTAVSGNQAEVVEYFVEPGDNPRGGIRYYLLDSNGERVGPLRVATAQNQLDDPATPEDESTTDFTTFAGTWYNTMKTRADILAWTQIQENFETEDTP